MQSDTPLKSIFSGQLWSTVLLLTVNTVCIRLAVVSSHVYEITRNSVKIRTYSSSWSSMVIGLGANRERIWELSVNRFRDVDTELEMACPPPHPFLVWRPAQLEPVRISGWNLPCQSYRDGATVRTVQWNFVILSSAVFDWFSRFPR